MGIFLVDASHARPSLAVMGGSFDPIHNGHLVSALDAKAAIKADEFRLLPCHIPPHKPGMQTSPADRLAMLQLVVDDCAALQIDERELRKNSPSYTVETLRALRAEQSDVASIVFVMGWDSLQNLPTWYCWQEILTLANIAVVRRPSYTEALDPKVLSIIEQRKVDAAQLRFFPSGKIAILTSLQLEISASNIRERINSHKSIQYLVPDTVRRYIEEQGLYQNRTCCNRR